ncbi:MAG: hypothetical protein LBN71_00210 [Tannerella sp.]|nr:hypothetical protein [Tannerella sp.]
MDVFPVPFKIAPLTRRCFLSRISSRALKRTATRIMPLTRLFARPCGGAFFGTLPRWDEVHTSSLLSRQVLPAHCPEMESQRIGQPRWNLV